MQPEGTNTDVSEFVPLVEHNEGVSLFEQITPLDTGGNTCLPFVVKINGQDFFMKRLKFEYSADEAYRELFYKEYELGSRLDSPYIVKYVDLAEDELGLYILCENVVGATIEQKISTTPEYFTQRKNLDRLFLQLLTALKHMHQSHVVHADLKPQNVMLTRINNDVKVIDLGFAYADSHPRSVGCTREYAAPEQVSETMGDINATTDIYAIGKLIEYIQQQTGKHLPRVYQKIMKWCLQEQQHKRPQSIDEILNMVQRRSKVIRKTIITLSVLSLVLVVGYVLLHTHEGRRALDELVWAIRTPKYDIVVDGVYYAYNAPDSSTFCVVGGTIIKSHKIIPEITLPNGKVCKVTSIQAGAFRNHRHLEALYIPEGIEEIHDEALKGSGVLVVNLPSTVKEIGMNVFADMPQLQELYLGNKLKELPSVMAHHNKHLKLVQLPRDVRILPVDILAFGDSIKTVIMPDSLQRIERGVFWECRSLEEITLPATLEYIGEYAFYHCSNLKHIYLHAMRPPLVIRSFNNKEPITLHVPKASVRYYKEDDSWKNFNIVGDVDEEP